MSYKKLLSCGTAMALFAIHLPAAAQTHTRLVQQGIAGGVNFCLSELDVMVKVLHPDDTAYGAWGVWSLDSANAATWASTAIQLYEGNPTLTNFAVSREPSGKCSIVVTQTFFATMSCGNVRQAIFKDWEYYGTLAGQYGYQAPGTDKSGKETVILANTSPTTCMGQKRVASFGMTMPPTK